MMGRTRAVFSSILLALLIGVDSQVLQQPYLPRGRYYGRQWTFLTRTEDENGQPSGTLVSRIRQGFLSFDQDQIIGEPNRIPVLIDMVEMDPEPSTAIGGSLEPENSMVKQTPSTDFVLSNAIESQTGPGSGNPVAVDAEENNLSNMYNHRNKRDYGYWLVLSSWSPSTLFSDRRIRDSQGARESRNTRAIKSAVEGTSDGIMAKCIIPFVEDVDETSEKGTSRYRRGTDDNLS